MEATGKATNLNFSESMQLYSFNIKRFNSLDDMFKDFELMIPTVCFVGSTDEAFLYHGRHVFENVTQFLQEPCINGADLIAKLDSRAYVLLESDEQYSLQNNKRFLSVFGTDRPIYYHFRLPVEKSYDRKSQHFIYQVGDLLHEALILQDDELWRQLELGRKEEICK